MKTIQKATLYFAIVNLIIGVAGFIGPLVIGNDDGLININPGMLLGIVAINWLHATLHLTYGLLGLWAKSDAGRSRSYMGLGAVIFGLMAVMGILSFGFASGIYIIMGMAVDAQGNVIHIVWFLFTLAFFLRPDMGRTPQTAEPANS